MIKEKCVIYTRVSSDEQREEGYSLDYQFKEEEQYCKKNNLQAVKHFSESHTAKMPGRPEFNKMLKYAKQNKIYNIVFMTSHRASRNPVDSAQLSFMAEHQGYKIHLIQDKTVLSKKSSPQDFMIFEINNGFDNLYSRNLSREISSKLLEKARQGYYPMRPMVGYKRDPNNKKARIIPDPEKAPFVVKCFELYATGLYSYKSLAAKMREEGFYISKNHPCGNKNVEDILNNPIYMGEFQFKDYYCKDAKHIPLITKELYYSVQSVIKGHTVTKSNRLKFLFSGLVKYGVCGCSYTWENKKGAHNSGLYVYGHCTGNRGGTCKKKYIREEQLENCFLEMLEKVTVPTKLNKMIINAIKYNLDEALRYDTTKLENLIKKRDDLNKRVSKLLVGWADGIIDDESYSMQKNKWSEEIKNIETQISMINLSSENALENAKIIIELCKNARARYCSSSIEDKRAIIKIMCSNLSVIGKDVTITLHSAFENLIKVNKLKEVETRGVEPLSKMD